MSYKYEKEFRQNLVEWFENEKRDLPWRKTKDPYKIWVSEVMLQQTRVDTVIPYYENFLEKFPTVQHLADAEEEFLLKQWEGLGYYSRVRNLQAGVREVVETYNSIVPKTRKEISTLKGVGPYTAGAVLSIAYGVPEHAVDGNVMRVLSRVLLLEDDIAQPKSKKVFEKAVMDLIDVKKPSEFNQGLMELGALVCTPTSPKCLLCPVRDYCGAFAEGRTTELPIKTKKTKVKKLSYDVFVVENEEGKLLLEKRPETGLLANMWQFPMIEQAAEYASTVELSKSYQIELGGQSELPSLKHIFSHIVWNLNSFYIKGESTKGDWFTLEQIAELPLPVPMQKILHSYKIERCKID
ncbi:adenine DNA glycosylase [Kurthia zopfii]|uniref:Adenine DNA glycosylase n=1 Tax=Kurthia zopfii TaxID=1650 RepID=A0A8B4QDB2_9BACL|nr:A/G-specific adenine glycosylase [Kurthia zopfii]PWI22478.1 A/G-specific adenine glycosylase [Kurthia zopfii]TDR38791.1 A/G-specific DNA-adenine glycosylase [Kurthia zopfii]GEK31515.1 adenine DNA glycosylase [Kurthia zopfii]STX10697.1 A/G-specific adenine glycosylase [Kurthia zopfii]